MVNQSGGGNVWQCVDAVRIGRLDTKVTGPSSNVSGCVPERESRRRHERILLRRMPHKI